MSVTGREYKHPRPRGLAPWKPQAKNRALLDEIKNQLDLWREQWPLTGRQIYYGLVGRNVIDKTEKEYKNGVLHVLNRGRRAGYIPWEAIRDDGASFSEPWGFHGTTEFWEDVKDDAEGYRRRRQAGQDVFVEVWCETSGMAPQLRLVADDYGVPVMASGGFDSVTAHYDSAVRFKKRHVPTVVLQIGDHDPSGCAIVDSAADDVAKFYVDIGANDDRVTFRRLAVTPEQIVRLGLPTSPQKKNDKRGKKMLETVQAEAIPPAEIARLLTEAIEGVLDMDVFRSVLAVEKAERDELIEQLNEFLGDE